MHDVDERIQQLKAEVQKLRCDCGSAMFPGTAAICIVLGPNVFLTIILSWHESFVFSRSG